MEATEKQAVTYGLVPYENALEGSVIEVLETLGLQKRQLQPQLEFLVPVLHGLIQKAPGPIHTVVSHPQALGQCRETLIRLYGKDLLFENAPSTSEAVKSLQGTPAESGRAALGSRAAAERYGLQVIHPDVSDAPDNMTRFFLLSASAQNTQPLPPGTLPPDTPLKTSLCLGLQDRPGALVDVLLLFKQFSVNLTKIESRPSRKRFGEYLFHIDTQGDLDAPEKNEVLNALKAHTTYLQRLGPYASLGRLSLP
jgi:prephenate dehydratase